MRLLLCVAALCGSACISEAHAADFVYSCQTLGADAGDNILIGPNVIQPNTQFMVSTNYAVNYKVCKTSVGVEADGGPSCKAASTDAPIPSGAQVDLCMPSGYPYISFYKLYDGGNPSVCTYLVTPKTVCQINTAP